MLLLSEVSVYVDSEVIIFRRDMKLKKSVTCCLRGNSLSIKCSTKVIRQVMLVIEVSITYF